MAELLRLESTRLYGSSNRGCIWGLFHMIDSYQRRVNKRMVSNRKQGGRQCGAETDILMENETGEDTDADKEESNIVKNKSNDMNKRSGKTHILNFIGKKLLKRQKHKGKMSNSSSRLLRTNSVHHLEGNDYVTPSELSQTTSDSETSTITVGLDETDSLTINGLHISVEGNQKPLGDLNTTGYNIGCISHKLNELGNHLQDEHIVLKEKIFEARDALLKQKDSDPKGMTVEFLLLSQNFLDILHLFNINREALYNVCKGQNSFVSNDMQAFGCPSKAIELNRSVSFSIPSRKHIEFDKFINQGSKHESVNLLTKTFGVVPDIEFLTGSHELRKRGETKTVLSRLRELKQRLKSVIVENKKEHHRISMDRILDKVPSGHKFLEDEEDDKLNRREGPVSEKNFKDGNGFKFSRMALGSSIGKFAHNGVQRSRSLTESLDRYSQLLDSISSFEVRKAPESSNSIRESSGLLHRKLPKTHRRIPSNPEFLSSSSFIKDVQSEVWIAFQSSNKPTLETFDNDLSPTSGGSDELNKDSAIQPESVNECLQIAPLQFSKIMEEKNDLFNEQESQIEDEPNVKPEKTSPISVLDSNIEEPVSPLKFTVMAGSDPHQSHKNLEEQLPCPQDRKNVDFNEPNINEETISTTSDQPNSFLSHIDEKDTPRFNYVKHILSKTGYEPLLCETENSSIEVHAGIPFEEQLLYDLINEILFEIYEYSTAPSSWLSRFHSKIRSMPTGSYLLEEVWAEITWHLSSPQGLDAMADKLLARNFTKNDDWMNLYRDAECFGLLLEQLILDDLVDEVVVDN